MECSDSFLCMTVSAELFTEAKTVPTFSSNFDVETVRLRPMSVSVVSTACITGLLDIRLSRLNSSRACCSAKSGVGGKGRGLPRAMSRFDVASACDVAPFAVLCSPNPKVCSCENVSFVAIVKLANVSAGKMPSDDRSSRVRSILP